MPRWVRNVLYQARKISIQKNINNVINVTMNRWSPTARPLFRAKQGISFEIATGFAFATAFHVGLPRTLWVLAMIVNQCPFYCSLLTFFVGIRTPTVLFCSLKYFFATLTTSVGVTFFIPSRYLSTSLQSPSISNIPYFIACK